MEKNVIENKEKESKIIILEMEEFFHELRLQVIKTVTEKYKGKLPSFEYGEYLVKNPNKIPERLKDGDWYFLLGSPLISYIRWDGKEFILHPVRLIQADEEWNVADHLILLEK